MRNVKFTPDMIKEIRRLARDANKTDSFKAALTRIYTVGYENGNQDAYDDARQKLLQAANHADQSTSTSDNVDGERV